jgi:hypothetical protein
MKNLILFIILGTGFCIFITCGLVAILIGKILSALGSGFGNLLLCKSYRSVHQREKKFISQQAAKAKKT